MFGWVDLFHSCKITICQVKNSQTRKKDIEKHISHLPRFIIINIFNYFVEFVIGRNINELFRGYIRLKNVSHMEVSVNPHEISSHPSFIYSKNTNVFIVKLLILWFINGMWLVIYTRTEKLQIILWEKSFYVQWCF